MPPREASNIYPDHYLTLDFENNMPPLPHDPLPDHHQHHDPTDQDNNHSPNNQENENDVTDEGGAVAADGILPLSSGSSAPHSLGSSHVHGHVDPLSIDPTEENDDDEDIEDDVGVGVVDDDDDDVVLLGSGGGGVDIGLGGSNGHHTWPSSPLFFTPHSHSQSPLRPPVPVAVSPLPTNSTQDCSPISHYTATSSSNSPVSNYPYPILPSRPILNNNRRLRRTVTDTATGLTFNSVLDQSTSMEEDTEQNSPHHNIQTNYHRRRPESFSQTSNMVSMTMENQQNNLYQYAQQISPPSQQQHVHHQQNFNHDLPLTPPPPLFSSSDHNSIGSFSCGGAPPELETTTDSDDNHYQENVSPSPPSNGTSVHSHKVQVLSFGSPLFRRTTTSNTMEFSFGPHTTVPDLVHLAERGCIVALLGALNTPRLVSLGCRMLADYAKMPGRRVAVACNRRILQFLVHVLSTTGHQNSSELAREYAVEALRSLTATEESDVYLMGCRGMLPTLAKAAHMGGRARLHACIAVMNLSCGKRNKVEIASCTPVLEAMRDAMWMSSTPPVGGTCRNISEDKHAAESRLKATTCIKNLSNADANDAALISCPSLVEALGHVAAGGEATATTNACLALMNLSISKVNKHTVFRTPGVMDALVSVLRRADTDVDLREARVKACSALSNLAIGYDNKIPMFSYPGFVDAILCVIETDRGEARTKACSILWSFAAEMKNQVPVVKRGDILPVLVRVAEEDTQTEARFKCVAGLTLLAESPSNAIPLLEAGALSPLMDILHEAGPDPTQWLGQTASWCVGFLMNMAQSDDAVPALREAGVVELLSPLLTLDHYQSLKAAMAVTTVCRYDRRGGENDDVTYDLLRKTESVLPKIVDLLHNTLEGRGGSGYKYGVFTLRSSVGCLASLANGPDFIVERIATPAVMDSLYQVLEGFCVDGGTPGAIVGGGRDDAASATLASRALHRLVAYSLEAGGTVDNPERLAHALDQFSRSRHPQLKDADRRAARETCGRVIAASRAAAATSGGRNHRNTCSGGSAVGGVVSSCCGAGALHTVATAGEVEVVHRLHLPSWVANVMEDQDHPDVDHTQGDHSNVHAASATSSEQNDEHHHSTVLSQDGSLDVDEIHDQEDDHEAVRTFLLSDERGRRFAVPIDPSGGRSFNDNRVWCYRRGRFCREGEVPDPKFQWSRELQKAYLMALALQSGNSHKGNGNGNMTTAHSF